MSTYDKKISALTETTSLAGTDLLPLAKDLGSSTYGSRFIRASNLSASIRSLLGLREILTANRTYYVNGALGLDTNTGLAAGSGFAFKTIQRALNVVAALDLSIYNVTINVSDGTYPDTAQVIGPWVGTGTVTIVGNTTTPANCIISTTNLNCLTCSASGRIQISGFELRTTTSGSGLYATGNGQIAFTGPMRFGTTAAAGYHMQSDRGGIITGASAYSIVGGAGTHIACTTGGNVIAAGLAVTLAGTPAFSTAFIYCSRAGLVEYYSNTFPGTGATGTRYISDGNSVVFVLGGGPTYLPGSVAGSTSAGGQYY